MDNPRPEKVAVVDEVRERLDAAEAALLTEYRGLDVAEHGRAAAHRCARPAATTRSTRTRWCASPPATSASRSTSCSPARRPSPSSADGDDAVAWPRRCGTSPRPTRTSWSRAACSATSRCRAAEATALADVAAPRGAARPVRRRPGRPDAAVRRPAPGPAPQLRLRPAGPHRGRAAPPAPASRGPGRRAPTPRPPTPTDTAADRRRGSPTTAEADTGRPRHRRRPADSADATDAGRAETATEES